MRIAILTSMYRAEFGVARVIASQLPFLVDAGFEIDLYACELDRTMLCPGVHAVREGEELGHFRGMGVLRAQSLFLAQVTF